MRRHIAGIALAIIAAGCASAPPKQVRTELGTRWLGYHIEGLREHLGQEARRQEAGPIITYFWGIQNGAGTGACEIEVDVDRMKTIRWIRSVETNEGAEACPEVLGQSTKG